MVTKASPKTQQKSNKFVVSGKVFWANTVEPNALSGKYQLDLSVDEETAKIIESKGVTVRESDKEGDERGQYVTLKSNFPPRLYDSKKREITEKIMIGNGSEVSVLVSSYDWKFKNKSGTSLGADAVQIKNLVEFKGRGAGIADEAFEEVDGFEAGSSTDSSSNSSSSDVEESDNPF